MSNDDKVVAISYYIEEVENEPELNIEEFMNEIEQTELDSVPHKINYHENFTVKELLTICEYYGCSKYLKANKCNKEQIIDYLVTFESDLENTDIVFRRQNMWFYINELKNDQFMKKFVLW